ncbi:hypothetical protein MANI_029472 [Metarhizium anisopliae]|nr:hypothetical protein MANI_029472 [Metarhizium anisopliae]
MAATPFQVEAWTEYAIGMTVLVSRIAYRIHVVGWNWHGDDYFALAAAVFFTGETAMLEMIGKWGSIVGMTDDKALSLTHAEKERIVKGSKADMAGWCLYITLIWCLKACMLFFYRRLTLETRQRRLVIIAAVACVFSYMATIGVVLLRCLPFHKNWQIYPYPGDNCGSPNQIFFTLVATNVSTDLLILYIPLPLLWIVRLPWSKKLVYGLWLTTGMFVIIASLLRCVLSIKDATKVDVSTIWAIRETFVGIISVNAPILGPWIIRKCTNMVHSISSNDRSESDVGNRGISIVTIGRQNHRLERRNWSGQKHEPPGWTTINDSEEYIMDNPVQQHNSNGAPSSHATSLAAFQQV